LGISDYQNTTPDFVRGPLGNLATQGGLAPCFVSGNFSPLCSTTTAVSTVNLPAPSSIALSDLPNLTPLAFHAVSGKTVTPVALGSPGANSWVYPVLTGADGQHTLDVVFDYGPWTNGNQPVSSFTFPLVILNGDNSETPVVASLKLTPNCNGANSCTVTGVGTNPLTLAQLGIGFAYQLAPSPNLSTPHAIFTFRFPVIVTRLSDPVYFGVDSSNNNTPTFINQLSGAPTAFSKDDRGFTPTSVGRPVGVSPYPAPLCPATGCPSTTPPPPTFYGFCATITGTPVAATFASVGTDGTTYATSPVGLPQPQCP
jgi:hypothetical protein